MDARSDLKPMSFAPRRGGGGGATRSTELVCGVRGVARVAAGNVQPPRGRFGDERGNRFGARRHHWMVGAPMGMPADGRRIPFVIGQELLQVLDYQATDRSSNQFAEAVQSWEGVRWAGRVARRAGMRRAE